jgi:restriction endonuclease Mrr
MAGDAVRPYLLPSLVALRDGNSHTVDEVARQVPNAGELEKGFLRHRLKGNIEGIQAILDAYSPPNDVPEQHIKNLKWSIKYLKKSKLIENTKKGSVKITQKGMDLLSKNPAVIDIDSSEGNVTFSNRRTNPQFVVFDGLSLNIKNAIKRR